MGLESRYYSDFGGFWIDFGGMLASSIDPKSELTSRGRFSKKKIIFLLKNQWFSGIQGSKLGVKIGKNRCKFEVQHKVSLGIDFSSILVGFGRQTGGKTEPRSTNNQSKKASKKWWKKETFWEGQGGVLGGGGGRTGRPRVESWTPQKHQNLKENHQTPKPKAKHQGQRNTLTRQARKRGGG